MNFYSVILLIIFSIIIIIPTVNAQTPNEGSNQKSIQVTIGTTGEMHAVHVMSAADVPSQIDLIDGIISNLSVTDQDGEIIQYGTIGDSSLMIFPSKKEVIIEYNIEEKLILVDNIWTLDFLYIDTVSFIFPQQVDLIFVNDKPAYLGEKKGILCHGCSMILEYSLDEPKLFESVKMKNNDFLIEFRTWAEISQFNFEPNSAEISFEVIGNNDFVTTLIPVDLLSGPYQVFLNEEKILFHEYINNGTHIWLNMKPQNSGDVSITGSLVPDKSEFEIDSENQFSVEYLIVGFVISGIIIIGMFFLKRKKG